MKKPIAGGAPTLTSTDVNPHTNNYLLFQQQQGDESFFKLSLPLMVSSFWLPFLLFLSTFGFNHGDEGNVDVHNHNPYTKEQDQNHPDTDRVLLEFNVSDSTAPSQDPHTSIDTETNQIQGTTQYEEQVTKVLGYSALVCEREIQDSYVEKKQEDIQTGKTHLTYLDLDEFRNTTQQDIGLNGAPSGLVNITHRLEPDGTKYNYASASKGAKVLAYNKEANGATNILGKDHDRYLRNPCSVSDKYVIIELSEETLVDAVKIANFEHHSSNFKEFSLSGSLVFPTENWYHLGNFVAENVKHHQYFKLPEPKWARYLNLTLISQYGWEFYCTLNVVEVYGVDAIERMLEDLIVTSEESSTNPNSTATSAQSKGNVDDVEGVSKKIESGGGGDEGKRVDDDVAKKLVSASKIPELVAKGNGRIHGDAVLKILMQKVRLLEKNLSLLEDFIKELNKRQGDVLPKVDVEIGKYSGLVEKTRMEIKEILLWKTTVEKEIADLVTWKAFVSSHLESIVKENAMLREAIANVASDQESLDKAELTFLTMSVSFVVAVILKAISDRLFNSSAHSSYFKTQSGDRSWKLLFLTCVVTGVIVFNLY